MLLSLVPKDWNSAHEVAWSWLWENVERMIEEGKEVAKENEVVKAEKRERASAEIRRTRKRGKTRYESSRVTFDKMLKFWEAFGTMNAGTDSPNSWFDFERIPDEAEFESPSSWFDWESIPVADAT